MKYGEGNAQSVSSVPHRLLVVLANDHYPSYF